MALGRTPKLISLLACAACCVGLSFSGTWAIESQSGNLVAANNQFAWKIYRNLSPDHENLFFSPLSIHIGLAMAYSGAREKTAQQIAACMAWNVEQAVVPELIRAITSDLDSRDKSQGSTLTGANAAWLAKGYSLKPEYTKILANDYQATAQELDFAAADDARRTINRWIEERTGGAIKTLITEGMLDPSVKLILTNAVYFNGRWESDFDESTTQELPFTLPGGKRVPVPMMDQTADFGYWEGPHFKALEMPYKGVGMTLLVLLPDAVDGLPDLEQTLSPENVNAWTKELEKRRVWVQFPKIVTGSRMRLSRSLEAMGVADAFDPKSADFRGMEGSRRLFLGELIHQAVLRVDERGTQAAAATGAVNREVMMPSKLQEFKADHPFVFVIRDVRSGCILFLGRITNPKSN